MKMLVESSTSLENFFIKKCKRLAVRPQNERVGLNRERIGKQKTKAYNFHAELTVVRRSRDQMHSLFVAFVT